ncbi:MAG: lamin tail domain-containing protein [Dehalococcoidia bacterium]|nr:lamin tail domain-containing protein [Dehalococcoidia bacterium]
MLSFKPLKAGPTLLLAVSILLALLAAACSSSLPSQPPPGNDNSQPTAGSAQAPAAPSPESAESENVSTTVSTPESPVQIKLIHYRGTLSRIGCCNPGLYERDEFVVIQNTSNTHVDITNWRLTNLTRGYPTFIFPSHFPCVPYELPPVDPTEEIISTESYYELTRNPAQSEIYRFSTNTQQSKPTNVPAGEVDWASCTPLEPLDETPMEPVSGEQGIPPQCILYPGQTILVFTDEIHCQTGGFSFNWGLGNIWNNVTADTAVLYDARGEEVSRRSYLVGR